jgi:hypothetical protein
MRSAFFRFVAVALGAVLVVGLVLGALGGAVLVDAMPDLGSGGIVVDGEAYTWPNGGAGERATTAGGLMIGCGVAIAVFWAIVIALVAVPLAVLLPLALVALVLGSVFAALAAVVGAVFSPLFAVLALGWLIWRLARRPPAPVVDGGPR